MLPASISEDKASLIPGTKRRGLSLIINKNGLEHFVPTWIIVENSFTYDTFPKKYDTFPKVEAIDSHVMIEMLMIRYNSSAATLLKKYKTGLLRVQRPAEAAEISNWTSIDPTLEFFAREAAQYIHGTEEETEHASLGLTQYCHASSPIRRYADLVNQRILKSILMCSPEKVDPELDTHLNNRMKASRRWARDLTFLTHVTPGKVHQLDVFWIADDKIWVPSWSKIIRAKHQRPAFVSSDGVGQKVIKDRIAIYCDPTKRCWKDRVLTASI
jgi:exoribonuclease R